MKKMLLIVFLFILIGIACFVGYFSLHSVSHLTVSEKKQALEQILGRAVRNPTGQLSSKNHYDGKYLSFSAPAGTERFVNKENSNGQLSLETFQFQNRDTHLFFTVDVTKGIEVNSFSDIADVAVRQHQPDVYTQTEGVIGKQPALLFTKTSTEGFEKTGFVLYKNRIYTFSATGANQDEVSGTFAGVSGSVLFH